MADRDNNIPSGAPFGAHFGLGRHRMQLNRLRTSLFNPEAAEFVPAKTSTKRKASSSASSGKAATKQATESVSAPIIRAKELFGEDTRISKSIIDDTETIEQALQQMAELEGNDAGNLTFAGIRSTANNIFRSTRTSDELTAHAVSTIPKTAVMLVCPDGDEGAQLSFGSVAKTRYLPLGSAALLGIGQKNARDDYTPLAGYGRDPGEVSSVRAKGATQRWPKETIPVELFDNITSHLSGDDVRNMRLVNHEFEQKVSRSLFYTSVVPFNTELYDMVEDQKLMKLTSSASKTAMTKLDLKQAYDKAMSSGLSWKNAKEDLEGKVYKGHGLRVFEGFGPHIKRFGMSFEVSEDQLTRPPTKQELDSILSYHGTYKWPPPFYARFDGLAGLERTADDTSRMREAFGQLKIVQELALSIDSGLGWMNGPDKSIYDRVFARPKPVFGSAFNVASCKMQHAAAFWEALQQSHDSMAAGEEFKQLTFGYHPLDSTPVELLRGAECSESKFWPLMSCEQILPTSALPASEKKGRFGVVYGTSMSPDQISCDVKPSELRKAQKEWLLETEWAQRAFLESYTLAIMDNPAVFHKVTALKLAKLSSSFINTIVRDDLFDALPSLKDFTIHVSPEWRTVFKDTAGQVVTSEKQPSQAVELLYECLVLRIANHCSIKKLDIGWSDGGEHATGIFARNNHLLPAPITPLEEVASATVRSLIIFKHVGELTLTNCWLTPVVLHQLIICHAPNSLQKLTLNSVSLTAHPRFPPNANNIAAAAAAQAQAGNNNAGIQALNLFINQQQQAQQAQAQQFLTHAQQMLAAGFGNPGGNIPNVPANAWLPPNPTAAQVTAFAAQHGVALPIHLAQALASAQHAAPANATDPPPTGDFREGSWPHLLSLISPGLIPSDLPPRQPWHPTPPRPDVGNLRLIELESCGYARLPVASAPFDQTAIAIPNREWSPWFKARYSALKGSMMEGNRDRWMGSVVQKIPDREMDALGSVWGMREGWQDGMGEAVEFDGGLKGGTGRFSGRISRSDRPREV